MLKLYVKSAELYDEEKQEFVSVGKDTILTLEHSLVSISKWEAKWQKPFLRPEPKTQEEIISYVKYMTITQNIKPEVYDSLTSEHFTEINNYIKLSRTATTFTKKEEKASREIITSEIIYYWMIFYGVPFECQKWHLNRLLTLIQICSNRSAPPKKMGRKELAAHNTALNKARQQKLNTRG